jgi:hypothetical protein
MNITVTPHGRTGNRLFQYALGLILAKDKNANFNAEPIPFFDNIKTQELNSNNLETFRTSSFGNNYYDYNFLLTLDKNIIIDSYVQKADILLKNRDFLKDKFVINNTLQDPPEEKELVIHIRETDYKTVNVYLGDIFYKQFIKLQNQFTKITIVTDNIYAPLIQELHEQGCNIFTKNFNTNWQYPYFTEEDLKDFQYMLHSKHLLISQSTFSWWAAFLGNQQTVYFSFLQKGGMWPLNPSKDDIDLYFNIGKSYKIVL